MQADFDAREIRKFGGVLAIGAAALASLPVLLGYMARSDGQTYLPFHLSLDDHMVYAAWMRQAMDGHALFDNRFTTDPQPGLTFHLLFLFLGWIAKVVGIPLTLTLARIGFSYTAVRLLASFVARCGVTSFTGKFALVTSVFGGGLAFLNWHTFGDAYTAGPAWLARLTGGRQPIDNWQPEAFVFPSMLTNGLFMAALCLILWTFNSVLDARHSWKPVVPGVVAFGVLMNVHSYDVALVAMVLVAFLVSLVASKSFDAKWASRAALIGLGAVPAALWFLHVLKNDPVFRQRAETLTYTTGFGETLVGVFPLFALALVALLRSDLPKQKRIVGAAAMLGLAAFLWACSSGPQNGYALSAIEWAIAFALAIGFVATIAREDVGWNLLWSWAAVSFVAPYFPALFQRKLAMMLVVPWAILAAIALANELKRMDRQPRNLVAALALAVVCLSSVFWLRRDIELVRLGVSKTVVHNLYLTRDETAIVEKLNEVGDGKNAVAIPGIPVPSMDAQAFVTDLSPILSGLTGVHTYAGHWSETPMYNERRLEVNDFFLRTHTDDERRKAIARFNADFLVAPNPSAYDGAFPDMRPLGEVVYEGDQLLLIKVSGR